MRAAFWQYTRPRDCCALDRASIGTQLPHKRGWLSHLPRWAAQRHPAFEECWHLLQLEPLSNTPLFLVAAQTIRNGATTSPPLCLMFLPQCHRCARKTTHPALPWGGIVGCVHTTTRSTLRTQLTAAPPRPGQGTQARSFMA